MSTLRNILALFGFVAAAFIAAFLTVVAGNTPKTERGVQSAQTREVVMSHELGWRTLVSSPLEVRSTNGMTGMMAVKFFTDDEHSNDSYMAFIPFHSLSGAKSPDPRTGNIWLVGDEVFVVSVPSLIPNGRGGNQPSTTFLITDWRRSTNSVATK